MRKRKITMLIAPFMAFMLVTACGTSNDNDPVEDDAPLNQEEDRDNNKTNDMKDMNENDGDMNRDIDGEDTNLNEKDTGDNNDIENKNDPMN